MMTRLIFLLALPCLLLLTFVSVGARLLGYQQARHPLIDGFSDNCTDNNNCWRGITPGITSLDEVRGLLLDAGYKAGIENSSLKFLYFYSDNLKPGCVKVGYSDDSDRLSYLRLYCIEGVSIGDVTSGLGIPKAVSYRFSPYGDSELLSYNGDGQLAGVMVTVGTGWGSLFRPVASIDLFEQERFRRVDVRATAWAGFVPMWRYCQLQVEYPRCASFQNEPPHRRQ
jgi:hypothetical protein